MRRQDIQTPGLHTIQHIQRRLVDVCIESVNHVELLADRNCGIETAEKLAAFYDEMAAACRKPHNLTKGKKRA